jgi:predicted MFS family arabinose efflux permease
MVGAYMCFYSVGSALGAAAATQVYALWGWVAVSLLGASISVTALVLWLFTFQLSTGPKADHAPESSIDLQLMQKKPQ